LNGAQKESTRYVMRKLSGRAFVKILEKHGWSLRRVSGSHHIYGKANSAVRISVPIYGNQALKVGLQTHLAKIAGLTEKDFE
jgi:predicted RNA binding protein YcfA (HicA-like mRNA interferase family)